MMTGLKKHTAFFSFAIRAAGIVFCLWVLTGCYDDLVSESPETGGLPKVGQLNFSFVPDGQRDIIVKSISGVGENAINNVWVIQLDANGNVLPANDTSLGDDDYFTSGELETTETDNYKQASVPLKEDVSQIYFIANAGEGIFSDCKTKSEIENKNKTITNENDLAINNAFPMSGVWDTNDSPVSGSSNTYNINMYRAVAYLDFTLKVSDELPDEQKFALSSIQVKHAAGKLHYFRSLESFPTNGSTPTTATTTYPALTLQTDSINYTVNKYGQGTRVFANEKWMTDMTECEGDLWTGSNNWTIQYYLPENARGKGTGATQLDKDATHGPNGNANFCTYIEIKGYYLHNGLVSEVTYHVYLGENNTNDYNIYRNTQYKVETTILGQYKTDTRINGLNPENYLDYTDNSSPWFVIAGEDSGEKNWATVENDGSLTDFWRMPTKKELMLAWIYEAQSEFSTNYLWALESTANGRWCVSMSTGHTLFSSGSGGEVGGQTQNAHLRAVKDW